MTRAFTDARAAGVAAASLHDSYEFYFGKRKDNAMKITDALRADANHEENTAVEAAYIKLCKACARLQREAKDAAFPDPDYPESPDYLRIQVNDGAHEIIDLAHELITALKKDRPA
jgi:hypothetical protein